MGFITNEEMTHELKIRANGERFKERLSKEQEAICIMGASTFSAQKKLERMQKLGYSLEEILDIAFAWDKIDKIGASEFAARYLKLGEQI